MAGRPKRPGDLKDARVTVRMPADQLEALAHEAGMAGLSTAAYCRALISGRRPVLRNEVVLDASDIRPAVLQLARVGNNLNQIAHWLNRHTSMDAGLRERTLEVYAQVQEAALALSELASRSAGR